LTGQGSPTASSYRSPAQGHSRTQSDAVDWASGAGDGDGFGDDFDDFEEGQEGADDDFGDFDEGFAEEEAGGFETESSHLPAVSSLPHIVSNLYQRRAFVAALTKPAFIRLG